MSEEKICGETGDPCDSKGVLREIEKCFVEAHKGQIEGSLLEGTDLGEKEKGDIIQLNVKELVRGFIEKEGGDYNNPQKEDLTNAINKLKDFASNFRDQSIIQKNYEKIKKMIDELE